MKKKLRYFILAAALMNSLVLLILSYWLSHLPITPEDEYQIIKFTSALKHIGLNWEEKPHKDDFLFVNVAYAKQLIPKYDETGIFPIGNEAITDRHKLALFYQKLNENPTAYTYSICDIHLIGTSPDDSLLNTALNKAANTIVSYHYNASTSQYEYPIVQTKRGLADYIEHKESLLKDSGGFLKYRLVHFDSVKSLPLLVYEDLTGERLKRAWPFDLLNGNNVLNSFILNFRIRNHDLFDSDNPYVTITIDDLLLMDATSLATLVKDKIIVIGDFTDRDIHDTIYGKIPGSLILVNAYLALVYGDNQVRGQLVVVLLLVFIALSYLALYPQKFIQNWIGNKLKLKSQLSKYIFDFMTYFIVLVMVSLSAFFIYNIHLNVFFLASELYLISKLTAYIYKRMGIIKETSKS